MQLELVNEEVNHITKNILINSFHELSIKNRYPIYSNYDYIFNYDKFLEPLLIHNEEIRIPCKICGQYFKKISHKHLEKHGITMKEYKETYNGFNSINEMVRRKVKTLYLPNVFKWRVQQWNGDYYQMEHKKVFTTKEGNEFTCQQRVNEELINLHIKGKRTISIFPYSRFNSAFMVFDVDTGQDSKRITQMIINELEEYMNRENIYVFFSGRKGYHITLYFFDFASTDKINEFGRFILKKAGITEGVEIFPSSGRAIKLPLGIHRVTGNYCCMVDNKDFSMLPNQYYNFLNIQQIDPAILNVIDWSGFKKEEKTQEAVNIKVQGKPFLQDTDSKIKKIEKVLKEGITESGSRHYWALRIVKLLWSVYNYNKEKTIEELENWFNRLNPFLRKDDDYKSWKDTLRIIDDAYNGKLKPLTITQKIISIYKYEINFINNFKDRKIRLVLMALLMQSKIYKNDNYTFYVSNRQLEEMTDIPITTIKRKLEQIIKNDLVLVLSKGSRKTGLGTKYRLNFKYSDTLNTDKIDIGDNRFSNCSSLLDEITGYFLSVNW